MSTNLLQPSFASGELAPSLLARTDLAKYHSGAATMRNFFVDYRSGASSRVGTSFVKQAFNSAKPVRLVKFQSSVLLPYILEFGDGYLAVIANGGAITQTPLAITAATRSSFASITVPGNPWAIGDWIFVSHIAGMVQLNNRFFEVATNVGGVVTLKDVNGIFINSLNYGPYVAGGTAAKVYKIGSPYAGNDLALLKFVQVSNTMYITHPNYPPTTLTYNGPTNWVFATILFGPTAVPPTGLMATATAGTGAYYSFEVTSVDAAGEESGPSVPLAVNNVVNLLTTSGTISLSWSAAAGAVSYNVYKAQLSTAGAVPAGGAYGFIGTTTGLALDDANIQPDFNQGVPIIENPFAGNNPGCCCFFQQRLYYGGSTAFPQTFWASQPGLYNNFNISDPVVDSDAITGTLVSLQVNYIKSMVPMSGGLIILTAQGAWQISSGSGGFASSSAVTPANVTASSQGYYGASDVPPIPIGQDILYVSGKGYLIFDLKYNIYANIYSPIDISVLSNHLFYSFQIKEWTWAQEPFKTVWAVRSDGVLLSLTYVIEQEIYGWARHDTLGQFQSVASVTEGQTDAVYVVVKRFIQGRWVQMIERFADRTFVYGAEDTWAVDCGAQSSLPTPPADITISASTGTAIVISSTNVFSLPNVGTILRAGGGIATVTAVLSPSSLQIEITQPITQTMPNDPNKTPVPFPRGTWSMTPQFTIVYGLDHLEGQLVSILADGGVVTPQVVANGSITLPNPVSKVTVGLGFQAQLQTMPLDVNAGDGGTVQGKRKKIAALGLIVNNTRGLKAGSDFDHLTQIKELTPSTLLGRQIQLTTGYTRLIMDPLWDVPGQICLQLDDPLPATVLGIVPEVVIGDTK